MAVIQLPVDGSGKKLYAVTWNDGADDLYAQAISAAEGFLTTTNLSSATSATFDVEGYSSCLLTLSGTYNTPILQIEGTIDGSAWRALPYVSSGSYGSGIFLPTANTGYQIQLGCQGYDQIRVRVQSYSSGTLAVSFRPNAMTLGSIYSVPIGDVDHDAANSGTTLQLGGHASATPPTAVGSADRVRAWLTLNGAQVTTHETLATATVTNVAASATNVTLISSNTSRKGLIIQNDGTGTLYLKLGTTATLTTSFSIKLAPGGVWEAGQPVYNGRVDGIWSATGGNGALITELT